MNREVTLRILRATVKTAKLADAPVAEVLKALADMPEARAFTLTPAMLRHMLQESQPDQYAGELFDRAGYRVEMSLAYLANLAQHDSTLTELVVSVVLYLDKEDV